MANQRDQNQHHQKEPDQSGRRKTPQHHLGMPDKQEAGSVDHHDVPFDGDCRGEIPGDVEVEEEHQHQANRSQDAAPTKEQE